MTRTSRPPSRLARLLIPLLLVLAGCVSGGETVLETAETAGGGPRVVFDPLAHPNLVVPLPTDVATVVDADSPTGRRLNIRNTAPTRFERGIRTEINRLDGFGTFAPIMVSFDAPLDLDTVGPESIRLFNVDPRSERFGEEIPLDLPDDRGRSSYPVEITPWPFPPHSPFALTRQLLFDPAYQGAVGSDGYVDFYERETNTLLLRVLRPMDQQTEYMMVLTDDLKGEDGMPVRSAYATKAHTTQAKAYARLQAILARQGVPERRIAFAWSFTTQTTTRDLETISEGLRGKGPMAYLRDTYPPAFTQVADTETALDQLFCSPGGENPCRDNRWILQGEMIDTFMGLVELPGLVRGAGLTFLDLDLGLNTVMSLSLDAVDYFVFGRIRVPNLLETESEMFRMDYRTGQAWHGEMEVPFMIAIPRPTEEHQPPFPVVLHTHGIPALRWQLITEANTWARQGYASATLSVPMHSPIVTVQDVHIVIRSIIHSIVQDQCAGEPGGGCEEAWTARINELLDQLGTPVMELVSCFVFDKCEGGAEDFQQALDTFLTSGFLAQLLVEGRARDLDGDGNTDHGAIFTADLFRSRDRIRQHIVEQMQFLQLFKGLDQARVPPAVEDPANASEEELMPSLLAGDFNADGILDLGGTNAYAAYGPDEVPSVTTGPQAYFRSGLSFGGIANSLLMAVEPDVKTCAMSVPGGGLADIMTRMDLHAVIDRIQHEIMGPLVVGEPAAGGGGGQDEALPLKVSFIRRGKKDLLSGQGLESLWSVAMPVEVMDLVVPPGGSVRILNLANGEQRTVTRETLWDDAGACIWPSVLRDGEDLTGRTGCFSRGIASDKGDRIVITALDAAGRPEDQIETVAPARGMGKDRNTPDYRFFINLGQVALESADPINYARHWFLDPLGGDRSEENPAKNMMVACVPGDMFVPINTQVALMRAGGLMGSESNVCDGVPGDLEACGSSWEEISRDCDCMNLFWKRNEVMVGYHDEANPRFDVDGLTDGSGAPCEARTAPLVDNRDKDAGYAYVRFPYSNDWVSHGYLEPVNRGLHWLMAAFRNPNLPVDWCTYYQNQMAEYFATGGFAADAAPEPDCPCPIDPETCRYLPE